MTPPTSSAASAAVLEEITDAVEMDSILVANDAEVLTSAEVMYNPFERLWKLFPETVPSPDLPDRRLRKRVRCPVVVHVVSSVLSCSHGMHVCMLMAQCWRGTHQFS